VFVDQFSTLKFLNEEQKSSVWTGFDMM